MTDIVLDFLCHADFSGRLRKTRDDVGFCAFSAAVDDLRAENLEGTLLLDAGDAFSTNFWPGLPLVGAMNRNGTDAMCLGNHEFDRGPDFLKNCIAACHFPVLCANIREKATGRPITGTVPTVILERRGVKIGVLGLTTEYTPFMVTKPAFDPFEVTSGAEAAQTWIPRLRAAGAEVIVVLTHFPFYQSPEGALSGELWDLIKASPAADVWVGGHIPGDCARMEDGMCVVKAGFGGASIARARLTLDGQTHKILRRECRVVHTPPQGAARLEITQYVRGITDPFEPYFAEPLSRAAERWPMRLAVESKLGDFLADCLRFGGGTELAYMNATGACGCIEPGAVTRETLLSVAGYNDLLYTCTITGAQVWELMEAVYEPERFGNNGAMLISGFHVTVDHTRTSPYKVLAVTLPDGTPLMKDHAYTVSASAYIASGGNGTASIASRLNWTPTAVRFYDAMFGYTRSMQALRVDDFPRFTAIGTPENNHAPY
ncbi:MAG: 5'-nucleotidase C-terminal domain-containing protein [Oscillibacter sp.]|nr:5'-nucleotidase C-terminal domain-containing protein [Oscillibacter sp.]